MVIMKLGYNEACWPADSLWLGGKAQIEALKYSANQPRSWSVAASCAGDTALWKSSEISHSFLPFLNVAISLSARMMMAYACCLMHRLQLKNGMTSLGKQVSQTCLSPKLEDFLLYKVLLR